MKINNAFKLIIALGIFLGRVVTCALYYLGELCRLPQLRNLGIKLIIAKI